MFDNRKEKEELLEALVISDKDFIIPRYPQVNLNFEVDISARN